MSKRIYMLDTNICSFIIRKRPASLLDKLQAVTGDGHQVVVSAITYAELRFGAINKKASPKMPGIVTEFIDRLDAVLGWDRAAVEQSTKVKLTLERKGTPIGHNDILIAGHALTTRSVLVTDNIKEFSRIPDLKVENWIDRNC